MKTTLSVRLSRELINKFEELCQGSGITASTLLKSLVEGYLLKNRYNDPTLMKFYHLKIGGMILSISSSRDMANKCRSNQIRGIFAQKSKQVLQAQRNEIMAMDYLDIEDKRMLTQLCDQEIQFLENNILSQPQKDKQ